MSTVVKTERLKHIAALAERCGQNQIVGFAASEVSAIAAELLELRRAPVVPEHHQHLNELYHAQEKRLFKLAQRIKGPSFDKYAHSASQAIDVLEAAVFGQQPTNGKSELLQRAEKLVEDTAALARRVEASACTWRYDDEEHTWDGECGASWTFIEDGPVENSMHFCPGCGKPVLSSPPDE